MQTIFALIFTLLFSVCAVFAQNAKIDSLEMVIEMTNVDTVKGRSLCRLCWELERIGDFETGLKNGKEGLYVSQKENDPLGIATCLSYIGSIYDSQGNYSKALEFYQKSMEMFHQIGDKKGITRIQNNMGIVYSAQGNNPKALDCFQKVLKTAEGNGNQFLIASSLVNIGIIYDFEGSYTISLEYYHKAQKILEKIDYKDFLANCLNNIGIIYKKQRDYPLALVHFQKSLNIYKQIENKNGIADCLNGIGNIYLLQGNGLQALDFFQKSLMIDEQIGDTAGISISFSSIAESYLKLSQPGFAKTYVGKGLKLAQQIKHLEYMQEGAKVSFKVDSALGDYKSAFEHHKLFKQYSDSLHNEDKAKEFGRIESKYQFEKEAEEQKRKEIELAKIEAEKNKRRDNLQFLTIFAGIIGLFAGLVFLGKFKIPVRVMDVAVFAGLLITFEFLLILFDPWLDNFSGGIPFYKLGFNALVAFAFAPLHGFLEDKLKKRLVKAEK